MSDYLQRQEERASHLREEAMAKYQADITDARERHQMQREAIKNADREQYQKAEGDIAKQYQIDQFYNQKREEVDQQLKVEENAARKDYEQKIEEIDKELEQSKLEYESLELEDKPLEIDPGKPGRQAQELNQPKELTDEQKRIEAQRKLDEIKQSREQQRERGRDGR